MVDGRWLIDLRYRKASIAIEDIELADQMNDRMGNDL